MLPVLFDPELPVGLSLAAQRHPNCLVMKVQGVENWLKKCRWGWEGSCCKIGSFSIGLQACILQTILLFLEVKAVCNSYLSGLFILKKMFGKITKSSKLPALIRTSRSAKLRRKHPKSKKSFRIQHFLSSLNSCETVSLSVGVSSPCNGYFFFQP